MRRKGVTIRGKSARRKGSRAEISVRNSLRSIYPVELRDRVQRVPLSGAGAIKCDVMDNNDPDSAYEVKCQEKLNLNDWWRQAKRQSGMSRTPVLVITQAYRPFYYILRADDWAEMVSKTEYSEYTTVVEYGHPRLIFDRLSELKPRESASLTLDDDLVYIVQEPFYLEVKASLFEASRVK